MTAEKNPVRRPRVLIVEDYSTIAQTMALLLDQWGYEAQVVHDGEQAIQAAEKQRPDAVILDIGLPKLNGFEVAHWLRQRFGENLLIIAVTGRSQPLDRVVSAVSEIDVHLAKPADPKEIRAALERIKKDYASEV
jgi:DNA-binding response OmpR family regulator